MTTLAITSHELALTSPNSLKSIIGPYEAIGLVFKVYLAIMLSSFASKIVCRGTFLYNCGTNVQLKVQPCSRRSNYVSEMRFTGTRHPLGYIMKGTKAKR